MGGGCLTKEISFDEYATVQFISLSNDSFVIKFLSEHGNFNFLWLLQLPEKAHLSLSLVGEKTQTAFNKILDICRSHLLKSVVPHQSNLFRK